MPVADVYVHYVNKVERKDRTEAELIKVITWLTGFDSKTLKSHLKKQTNFPNTRARPPWGSTTCVCSSTTIL